MSQNLARTPGGTPGKPVSPPRQADVWVACWRLSDARKGQAETYYSWVMGAASEDARQTRLALLEPAARAFAHIGGAKAVLERAKEALEAMGSAAA